MVATPQNKWMQLTRSAPGLAERALAADPCVGPTEQRRASTLRTVENLTEADWHGEYRPKHA
jgi:hypothetical protein